LEGTNRTDEKQNVKEGIPEAAIAQHLNVSVGHEWSHRYHQDG